MAHPPVALERIDYQQDVGVIFHPSRPSVARHEAIPKAARPDGSLHLDPLESLAALTDHIPDKGQHLVRFYGWYSNKNRGLRKKRSSPDGNPDPGSPHREAHQPIPPTTISAKSVDAPGHA